MTVAMAMAMAAAESAHTFTTSISLILLLMIPVALAKGHTHGGSYLARGSSASIEQYGPNTAPTTITILASPNGAFACGFYRVASNAYTFSVWFRSSAAPKTVAWTANRDAPVNGRGSRLAFRKDGALALLDYNGAAVWSTNTSATRASRAELLDSGDLVVVDPDGRRLWGSFDSPTDTLLPSQPMTRHTKLVSASARGLLSSGLYTFYFDNDNQLKLIYNGPEVSSVYWPDPFTTPLVNHRTTYNSSQYGVLERTGRFAASDNFKFAASDLGDKVMRRLTLDYDGNLRLYSLNATTGGWSVSWMVFRGVCNIHGLCGKNTLCRYIPKLQCSCLRGFDVVDASDWSKGCRRKADLRANQDFSFRKVAGADFIGYDLLYWERVTIRNCKDLCLDNANCQAFGYRQGEGKCFTKVYLFNGKNFPNPHIDIYLKVPNPRGVLSSSPELASNKVVTHACKVHQEKEANTSSLMFQDDSSNNFKFGYFLSSALTLLFIEALLIITGCWVAHKWETRPEVIDEGYTIISSQFRIFSYRSYRRLQTASKKS